MRTTFHRNGSSRFLFPVLLLLFLAHQTMATTIVFSAYQTKAACSPSQGELKVQLFLVNPTPVNETYTITVSDGASYTSSTSATIPTTLAGTSDGNLNSGTWQTFSGLSTGSYTVTISLQSTGSSSLTKTILTNLPYSAYFSKVNSISNFGNSILDLDFKTDFCALGNGTNNDVQNGLNASNFINARDGYVDLNIPVGTYLLNTQYPSVVSPSFVFNFAGRENITITGTSSGGTPTSIFKFEGGQRYGCFDGSLNPIPCGPDDPFNPGTLFNFENCENITITNIEGDGNNSNMKLGGSVSTVKNFYDPFNPTLFSVINDIQAAASGLRIDGNCKNFTVTGCNFNNFCLDGIQINGDHTNFLTKDQTPGSSTDYNSFQHIECQRNARCGISISAGKFIEFDDCQIDDTGQGHDANNNPLANAPATGIDIEPNKGIPPGSTNLDACSQIVMRSCSVKNSFAHALTIISIIAPGQSDFVPQDITLENSYFADYDDNALEIASNLNRRATVESNGKFVTFTNSTIVGSFWRGCYAFSPDDKPVFDHVTFHEDDGLGPIGAYQHYNKLFHSYNNCREMFFDHCTFTVNHSKSPLDLLTRDMATADTSNYSLFNDCTFNYLNTHSEASLNTYNGILCVGCKFQGQTVFNNYSTDVKRIQAAGIVLNGSLDPCNPSLFKLGQNMIFTLNNTHTDGTTTQINKPFYIGPQPISSSAPVSTYANFEIPHGSTFRSSMYENYNPGGPLATSPPEIYIGEKSRFLMYGTTSVTQFLANHVYPDPSLPSLILTNEGQFILAPDVWVAVKKLAIQSPSSSNINYFDKDIVSPNWGNSNIINNPLSGSNCYYTSPGTPQVNFLNLSAVSTTYDQVKWDEKFTVYYKLDNNPCAGSTDGSIVYLVKGGTEPYSIEIDGNTSASNNINLASGTHTFTVTDAGTPTCSFTFSFTITEPPALIWSSIQATNPLCASSTDGFINVTVGGGTGTIAYTINSSSGQFTGLGAGNYLVTATDANGCTLTTTIILSDPPALTWASTNFSNITCTSPLANDGSIAVQATGGTGTITYILDYPGGQLQNTNGIFSPIVAHSYTVTAKDANNCSVSTMIELLAPNTGNFCCSPNTVALPNVILKIAPQASDLVTQYGNVITGKTFYIDDVLTINQDITFNACTLYFTPTGQVVFNGPYNFDVNSSTLQAACDWWQGIIANDPQNKVVVENNSMIKNAIIGIDASNNALLEISNSNFIDNQAAGILMTGITDPNYAGYVYGSTFDNATPIPNLPNALKVGIDLQNVAKMQIGDITDETKGNTFTHVRRGIGIWQGGAPFTSNIGIYNNQFNDINETYYLDPLFPEASIINNGFSSGFGAAVYAYNGGSSVQSIMNLIVKNTNLATSTLAFNHCDKGIITIQSSLEAENLYMDNVLMGICNFSVIGNTASGYHVMNNKLFNTYIGMQFEGDKANSEAIGNTIECTLYPNGIQTSSVIGADYIWPKGIEVSYYTNAGINSFDISGINHISIPHYAGVGIHLESTGSSVSVIENVVDLGNTDATDNIVCNGSTILAGIMSSQALGTRIHRNAINGNTFVPNNTPNDATLRIDAAGILLDHGQDQAIGCNAISGARFGLMAWSENNTNTGNELLVQGNTILDADAGWVFRHLATEGTLGQVGDNANDNNNVFPTLTGGAKVFKFCIGNLSDKIFTTSINPLLNESLSQNMNTNLNSCPYLIQANIGATVFNNDPLGSDCGNLQIISPWDGSEIPLDEAIAIATNTKVYVEFPTLAHWYDSKRLYEYLSRTPGLLDDYAVLDSFYSVTTNNAIAQIRATDQQVQNLIQSFDIYTPAQRQAMLQYIENTNEGIDNTEQQNDNEREINRIYLNLVRNGIDSLAEADKTFISNLAPQCPYVGGSAVYKARSLNYYLAPGAMYDDMKTCNAVGVYKQGNTTQTDTKSLISIESEALAQIKAAPQKVLSVQNEVFVYPVPANNYINIGYTIDEDATFILYNALGEKIVVENLKKENTKQRIELNNLANGIYSYEVLFANKLKSIGKITIIN